MKKRVLYALVLFVAAMTALYFVFRAEKGKEVYGTEKIKTGKIMSSVTATGMVNPRVSVDVGTQISGTIETIRADFNERVRKGNVLATVDRKVFYAKVEEAEAKVASLTFRLEASKAEYEKTKGLHRRLEELGEKGFLSEDELEASRFGLEAAKAFWEADGAELKNAVASLEIARDNLEKTVIRSPMDGIVLKRDVEAGQTVSAALSAPTLFTIGDLSGVEVRAEVDEADIGRVAVGQRAGFYVDSYPERIFEGEIFKIYYSPKIEQNVVTYDALIRVENPGMLLRPGMTANVEITIEGKEEALLLPNRALRIRLDDEEEGGKGPSVWTLKDGRPVKAAVRLGLIGEEYSEVLKGLQEGDEVIVGAPKKAEKRTLGMRGFH